MLGIFGVSRLIWQEQNQKLPPYPLLVAACFDEQGRRVFTPQNFILFAQALFPLSILFLAPTSILIIKLYLFSFLIISHLNFLV